MDDVDYRTELLYLAARLLALVSWAENELAGGCPPKYIALQLIAGARYIRVLALQARV